jgi:flagellin-like hook-associated protein FlgL
MTRWFAGIGAALVAIVALSGGVAAQDYPTRTVKIIVPFPPGGTADAMPRIVADFLAKKWGQAVIIENRAGAGGNTGADAQTNISAEFDTLTGEINRIVGAAQYEGSTIFASLDFRVDDTGDDANDVITADLSSAASIDGTDADVTDATSVSDLLDTVNTAIGTLGAAESQLDFASKNLASKIENTAAAESTIRDADMAAEMTNYSKANIVAQAGMAILSQANSNAQSVLQLIRNG